MRPLVTPAAALLPLLLACGGPVPTTQPEVSSSAGIEVRATGGIAALDLHASIDSASGDALLTTRPLCAPRSECPDLVPPATRTLSRVEVDAFFARTQTADFLALEDDYGRSPTGADMRTYEVTIRSGGATRRLRGDDGTLPPLLAGFVGDVLNAPRGVR